MSVIGLRTASMASGYLNHPGLFEARVDAEGFYHSGDRGRIVDGRLHQVGRTQDHINVAGRKIDPTEIVAVVTALDGVEDALAFPDEDLNREAAKLGAADRVVLTMTQDVPALKNASRVLGVRELDQLLLLRGRRRLPYPRRTAGRGRRSRRCCAPGPADPPRCPARGSVRS